MKCFYINKSEDLFNSVGLNYTELFVYGAGNVSNLFLTIEKKFLSHFRNVSVIVSNTENSFQYINEYQVKSVSALSLSNPKNTLIVIATTEKVHKEIEEVICKYNIENCFLLSNEYYYTKQENIALQNKTNNIINVSFSNIPNMGDLLNPYIINNVFNKKNSYCPVAYADLLGIGSGLGNLFVDKVPNGILPSTSMLNIWGTGFISDMSINSKQLLRDNYQFKCVRGNLSKKKLELFFGKDISCEVGDPGLLSCLLLKKDIEKKYSIGIIPHYREKGLPIIKTLTENYKNALLINLSEPPIDVIEKISQCETIMSSSLHGCIVADSLNIPNVLVHISDIPYGDGFKYNDYYSIYSNEDNMYNIFEKGIPTVEYIKQNYRLSYSEVLEYIKKIKKSFPF